MNKFIIVLIGFVILASSVSCTRTVNQKMSFQLQLPSDLGASKVGSMAVTAADLNHLIINITGSGISSPIYFSWDSNDGANTPPSSFTLDVPQGSGRLVQVLAVYKDGGNQVFYYGDIANLSTQSANMSVTVNVTALTSNVGEGQIAGRYINSTSGTGPTGRLTTKYTPPGRPSMIIDTGEIFGGYFRAFALDGAPLEYVLDNGESLFEGPVEARAGIDTTYASIIYMPAYFRSNGPGSYELRNESYMTLGWFAPSGIRATVLGSKIVCNNGTLTYPEIQYAYTDDSGLDTPISWGVSPGSGTEAFIDLGMDIQESEDTDYLCASTGNRFVDYLSIDHMFLGNHDQPLAFKGPYQLKTHDDGSYIWREVLDVNYSSANGIRLKWDYLPGVITSGPTAGIDGSDIFWRANVNPNYGGGGDNEEYRTNGGYNCASLSSYGFQLLHSNAADPGNIAEDVMITNLPTGFDGAFNGGRIDLVMCPYSNTSSGKKYYQAGASYHSHSGGTPASEFQLVKLSGDITSGYNAYNNICTPFLLRGLDGYISNLDINFVADAEFDVYNDPDCLNLIDNYVTFLTPLNDGYIFYVKRANSMASIQSLAITDNYLKIANFNTNINFDDAGSITEQTYILAPTTIKKYGCYQASIIMRDSNNASMMLPIGSTDDRIYSWPSLANLTYHNTPDCSDPSVSPTDTDVNLDQSIGIFPGFYFKYTGPNSSLSITPSLSSGSAVPITGGSSIIVTSPGAPARISIDIPSVLSSGCEPFYLSLKDSSGFYSAPTSAFNVTLTASLTGRFYPLDTGTCSCTNSFTTSVSFPSGETRVQMCYENVNIETEEVTATGVYNGINLNYSMEIDNQ